MYVKRKINFESFLSQPDVADAAKKVEDDIAVDVAKKEEPALPVPMELNPIDADQAIEIANNHPVENEIDELTNYEQVLAVASDIDNNNIKAQKDHEVSSIFSSISKMPNPLEAYDSIKETEAYFNTKTNLSLSKEDIETHPDEVRNIIASELQTIQNKANNSSNGTWATIKEDCNNIRTLIKKAMDFIASKEKDLQEALTNIDSGRLTNHEVELASITEYVGNLRHFLTPYKGKGSLIELVEVLKMIMIEMSPYLTSSDNKIIKDIANNEAGALQKAINYISNAINTDPLNVKLKVKAANNPQIEDYAIYGKLTGTSGVEVLTRALDKKKLPLNEKSKYTRYIINASEIDVESFKDDLILVLKNFKTKFENLFLVYIKKYEDIEKSLKPIMVEGEVETVPDKSDLMLQALRITRFYFVELVKDRIIDKLNAYIGLIELCKLAFTQKEKLNTETITNYIDTTGEPLDMTYSMNVINGVLDNVTNTTEEFNLLKKSIGTETKTIDVDDDNKLAPIIVYKDGLYVKDSIYNLLAILNNHIVESTQPYKPLPYGPFIKYKEDTNNEELLAITYPSLGGFEARFITKSQDENLNTVSSSNNVTLSSMDIKTSISVTQSEVFKILDSYRKNMVELAPSINGILNAVLNAKTLDVENVDAKVEQIANLLKNYEQAVRFYLTSMSAAKGE